MRPKTHRIARILSRRKMNLMHRHGCGRQLAVASMREKVIAAELSDTFVEFLEFICSDETTNKVNQLAPVHVAGMANETTSRHVDH